jgi:all-trans-8'-apo-beta-carotenal 15,15'-oxygenase
MQPRRSIPAKNMITEFAISHPTRQQMETPGASHDLHDVRTLTEAHPTADFAPGIEVAFPAQFEEFDCPLECVEGQVPEFVRGCYYLNGPARFRVNDLAYKHWLDGDGMVSKLRFDAQGVYFKNRYVLSTKLVNEREAGKPLYRTFGTSFNASRLNRINNGLESPVNVSVYLFGDGLLAFGEQGLPWKLDLETLETVGQSTFNGRLNDASPFAAHPKIDPATGTMFNFGVFFSSQSPRLYLYCLGREGMRYRKSVPLQYPCSVHDFSLSEHYAVFYLSSYLLDIKGFLEDGLTVMDSLHWEPERGSTLLILGRETGEVVASLPIGNRYCLHLINSFERDGRLSVDLLEFDEPIYKQYQPVPNLFHSVPPGGPVRLVIDLHSRELIERTTVSYAQAPDFPAIDPRRAMLSYDEFWMLGLSATGNDGRKFFDQLAHANWNEKTVNDVYQSPSGCYLGGEPVFVGDPDSNRCVIVCQEFDTRNRKSYFLLFDAHRVAAGPVARLLLDHPLYLGFHAVFKPAPATR